MVEKDCFAFTIKNGHYGCRALKELYCKDRKCRFYKGKYEIDSEEIENSIKEYSQDRRDRL